MSSQQHQLLPCTMCEDAPPSWPSAKYFLVAREYTWSACSGFPPTVTLPLTMRCPAGLEASNAKRSPDTYTANSKQM